LVKLPALGGSRLDEMPFATGLTVTGEVIVVGARLVVEIIDALGIMLDGETKLEVGATVLDVGIRIDVDVLLKELEGAAIEIEELLIEATLEDTTLVGAAPIPPEYSVGPGMT
jgi:hypothetical protein